VSSQSPLWLHLCVCLARAAIVTRQPGAASPNNQHAANIHNIHNTKQNSITTSPCWPTGWALEDRDQLMMMMINDLDAPLMMGSTWSVKHTPIILQCIPSEAFNFGCVGGVVGK